MDLLHLVIDITHAVYLTYCMLFIFHVVHLYWPNIQTDDGMSGAHICFFGRTALLPRASKKHHRWVEKTAHSETSPPLNRTNICRFSSARLKLMMSHECADRENGTGLCTRGPLRPDICFRKYCGWKMGLCSECPCVCVCACVEAEVRRPGSGRGTKWVPAISFVVRLSIHVYTSGWVECVSACKTTVVFLPFQSLLLLTDNRIALQRRLFLYPILLWPLQAFVHIYHNNSLAPSLHQEASPSFLSLSRERLNLDENEIFISTHRNWWPS